MSQLLATYLFFLTINNAGNCSAVSFKLSTSFKFINVETQSCSHWLGGLVTCTPPLPRPPLDMTGQVINMMWYILYIAYNMIHTNVSVVCRIATCQNVILVTGLIRWKRWWTYRTRPTLQLLSAQWILDLHEQIARIRTPDGAITSIHFIVYYLLSLERFQ